MQVNLAAPRWAPIRSVVLVHTQAGAHNVVVALATPSPSERTHSGLPR